MFNIKYISLAASILFSSFSYAADAPLNFNYTATGHNGIRPSLIFNDGKDTYIQPTEFQSIYGDLERVGPYYVKRGLPETFDVSIDGQRVSIKQINKSAVNKFKNNLEVKAISSQQSNEVPIANLNKGISTTPTSLTSDLVIKRGEHLSKVVADYAKNQNITLNWGSKRDLIAKKNIRVSGENTTLMLVDFLKERGFETGGSDKNIFVMDKIEVKK